MKKAKINKSVSQSYEFRVDYDNSMREQKRDSDIDVWSLKKQEYNRYRQDTEERKLLSHWVMWVVSVWLFLVLFAIVFNKLLCFKIEPSVSLMLLGTTTVNILGLAFIVLSGLFDVRRNKDEKDAKNHVRERV